MSNNESLDEVSIYEILSDEEKQGLLQELSPNNKKKGLSKNLKI